MASSAERATVTPARWLRHRPGSAGRVCSADPATCPRKQATPARFSVSGPAVVTGRPVPVASSATGPRRASPAVAPPRRASEGAPRPPPRCAATGCRRRPTPLGRPAGPWNRSSWTPGWSDSPLTEQVVPSNTTSMAPARRERRGPRLTAPERLEQSRPRPPPGRPRPRIGWSCRPRPASADRRPRP